jgi:predicted lipoprotein with Yx(FWY)xxD motif
MTTRSRRFEGRTIPLRRFAAVSLIAGVLAITVSASIATATVHGHVAKQVVISTFRSAKAGTILTDGKTLYTLRPNASACASTCHKYWIEVLLPKGVTKATAGAGVSAAKLGSIKVTGGRQVTYGGKALFWFFLDKSPGQVKGNVTDTWGKWSDVVLVKPAGKPSTTTTAPTKTTTTTLVKTTTTLPVTTTTSGGGGGVGF